MKPALKPESGQSLDKAFEGVLRSLDGLEAALEKRFAKERKLMQEPQLSLPSNDREINRKIAAKLDQTINRLEMLLEE